VYGGAPFAGAEESVNKSALQTGELLEAVALIDETPVTYVAVIEVVLLTLNVPVAVPPQP
jgi:hypothetical protein